MCNEPHGRDSSGGQEYDSRAGHQADGGKYRYYLRPKEILITNIFLQKVCVPPVDKGESRSGDISEDLTEKSRNISRTESHGELLVFMTIFYLILLFNLLLKDSSGSKLNCPKVRIRLELPLVNAE